MNEQKAENILNFVRKYIQENQISPSIREICDGLKIRSTSTVYRYLHALEEKEKIRMDSKKNRSISIVESVHSGIPLIEQVQPETELFDSQNIQEYYSFEEEWQYTNALFAIALKKAYPEKGFQQGDILIAESDTISGEIMIYLNPEGYPEITSEHLPENCRTAGTVIAMIRKF